MLFLPISRAWTLAGVYLAPIYALPSSTPSTEVLTTTNTATAFHTISLVSTCVAKCTVSFPDEWYFEWQKISITANFTHATVVEIVNTMHNTTRYSTVFNEVPANITLPPTNDAGTRVSTTTVVAWPNKTITTVIAYPAVYYDYGGAYAWIGTHEFSTADSTYCGTATISSTISMNSHPIVSFSTHYWWDEDYTAYEKCTASLEDLKSTNTAAPARACATYGHAFPRDGDRTGWNYNLAFVHYEGSFMNSDLFPEFGQFNDCTRSANAPEGYVESVAILTVTSVSHEGKYPSSTIGGPISTNGPKVKSDNQLTALLIQQPTSRNEFIAIGSSVIRATPETTPDPAVAIGSEYFTANPKSNFVISSEMLTRSGRITLVVSDSIMVMELTTDTVGRLWLIGNGKTSASRTASAIEETALPSKLSFMIGSLTISTNSQGHYVVGDQSVTQGALLTVGSGASATVLMLGTATSSESIGSLVVSESTIGQAIRPQTGSYPNTTSNASHQRISVIVRSTLIYLGLMLLANVFCSQFPAFSA